jgi:hypothetical protein
MLKPTCTVLLGDVEADLHRIVGAIKNKRIDDDTVLATRVILLTQRHLHVLQDRTIERSAFRETDSTQ